jgi:hypothetical protein
MNRKRAFASLLLLSGLLAGATRAGELESDFRHPPDAARPWVYWYFMDGNLTREGMTADLEAMQRAGIGGAIFLEVNIGIPRGPVDFMSGPWRELFQHAVHEADRLGLQIALGSGPGWCGTGGPWVKPENSMQHLVASETTVTGPTRFDAMLPRPQPRTPYFGEGTLTPELKTQWQGFYRDVAALAFPTPVGHVRIPDIDEKALYHRDPFSSKPGVKPFLPAPADHPTLPAEQCSASNQILDLTGKLAPDGRLSWDVPPGGWTILRFGRTSTGQTTRPAPLPGLGFETDKFDRAALDAHFHAFVETLLKTVGKPEHPGRGLTTLHFDSWEMGSQNWSARFREEFARRRGYDPLRYLPVLTGRVVESHEISERFLWDVRQTAQELVVENHVTHLKELAHRQGLDFSVEPYDLNPCADLRLGSVADVPMCEFWSQGYGFPTEYSCFEAVSIAHTNGRPIVGAEAFTSQPGEDWRQYPGAMKAQTDWALGCGINRLVIHRYQHQPWLDRFPGMTMGPHGVYWERTQTWWDMVSAYHRYLARCQQLLRHGLPVADILYLAPEGAPHVFRPPGSATIGDLPDRRGYNFDGCDPDTLIARAEVRDGRIVFPDGMSYTVLVLPRFDTMTPALLRKIQTLVAAGGTVIGAPPKRSPSLEDYPHCDEEVRTVAAQFWDRVIPSDEKPEAPGIYPSYALVANLLAKQAVSPDFDADGSVRYTHRHDGETDIYFVANRENRPTAPVCRFRVTGRQPELWDAVTGEHRVLPQFQQHDGVTSVPLEFAPYQSAFLVFRGQPTGATGRNFPAVRTLREVAGPWEAAFDPKWGGPERATFAKLEDWTTRPEPGVRHYSGKATYRTTFDGNAGRYLSLGKLSVMAEVTLNGRDLGVVWCDPWRVEIPTGLLRERGNELDITVANLWINRLIADAGLPPEQRLTWTTRNPYQNDSPLQPSGLLGPVTLQELDVTP